MTGTLKVASLLAFTSITRGNIGIILLTMLILTLVAMNLIFVPSLLDGLVWGANDKLINTYVGNLIVEPATEKDLIRDIDNFIPRLVSIEGITAVSTRNSISAQVEYEEERGIHTPGNIRAFQLPIVLPTVAFYDGFHG